MIRSPETFLDRKARGGISCLEWIGMLVLGFYTFIFGLVSLILIFEIDEGMIIGLALTALPGYPLYRLIRYRRRRKLARSYAERLAYIPQPVQSVGDFKRHMGSEQAVKDVLMLLERKYLQGVRINQVVGVVYIGGGAYAQPEPVEPKPAEPVMTGPRVIKCPQCGAPITADGKSRTVACEYCGSDIMIHQ